MKHSPGPWVAHRSYVRAISQKGLLVCRVSVEAADHKTDVQYANARLIAKAPLATKLAETLRATVAAFDSGALVYTPDGLGSVHFGVFAVAAAALREWDAQ